MNRFHSIGLFALLASTACTTSDEPTSARRPAHVDPVRDETDPPSPPPSLHGTEGRPAPTLPIAPALAISSAVDVGGRTFVVRSPGYCDPRAISGQSLDERTRIRATDSVFDASEHTLFSEQGACLATSGNAYVLAVADGTHRETRNCPIVVEVTGCADPGGRMPLLALQGRHEIRWQSRMDAEARSVPVGTDRTTAFASVGLEDPWPAGASDVTVLERTFGDQVRVVSTEARLPDDSGSLVLVFVLRGGELRWRERGETLGTLEAYVVIDGHGFVLFTEEWGAWTLRSVDTGETWRGDWPFAFTEDYGH